ncbi:dynein regulatory complex subunit 4 [Fundulus heteroclitus]|uniref:dynein regulatory complex subunit 4 n=1 Tax=Fundulus heteroclitus TaxID=8078 RepID=UPI00165B0BE7|nr:dynein regulatory complex subunit 4 [Fundulus heteroclitus]XP_035993567.1 dynein regulatory complex subunit 4 [Fundulus heteroclitus]
MPQKNRSKKAGKAKPPTVVAALSTEEMSKDQLEEHIVRLREELDREREERSYFQLERDKIHALWDVSRRNLEEAQDELRNSVREKEEAEERHRVEITVYKQKLKHVLSEQHNGVFEVRTGAVSSSSLVQNQNTEAELELCRDIQNLQADSREKKLQEHSSIKQLKLNQQAELMKLSYEHEVRMREMELRYQRRMRSLRETEEKRRRSAIAEVEDRMRSRVESLKEEHGRVLRRGEEYFSQTQEKQQEELNRWKEDMKKLQKEEVKWDRNMSAAQQENRRLKETLQEVQQQIPELQRQLQECRLSKDSVERSRAQKKLVEKELRDLTVEHELLLQAFQKVQQERDELLKRQRESLLDVQQRSGLKKMLLQKKLAALTEALEKKEAQLSAALSVCSSEPTARSNAATKLEEILESKRVSLEALQQDLAQENQQLKASGPAQPDQ